MVLSVCRRVLGDGPDAEDAFQATFLILVQKAATIAQPELLSNWLFGVAARTARKARTTAARRTHHERQAVVVPPAPPPDSDWDDLLRFLDEELERLPQKYRAPLVLCYLDGLTNEQAARRLGWPSGSISYRLARARELLRQRLGRRSGLAPVLFPALLEELAPAPLSQGLAERTVETAMALARDGTMSGSTTPLVRRLVEEGVRVRRARLVPLLVAALLLALLAGVAGAAAAASTGYLPWSDTAPSAPPSGGGGGGCHR
jgi:RNA polymerase sigma factor (sigma-70 family)